MKPFERTGETAEETLNPDAALEHEKGILERLRGNSRKIAGVMMLVSALSFAPQLVEEVYAGTPREGPRKESVEKEKSPEQRAVDLLQRLYTLPDNPRATNPAHNMAMKKTVAQFLIRQYALERKGVEHGVAGFQDVREALDELNGFSGTFADRFLGNNDGNIDIEEIQKLQQETPKNPGISTLMEMDASYTIRQKP